MKEIQKQLNGKTFRKWATLSHVQLNKTRA
jgi:hypothetical protein